MTEFDYPLGTPDAPSIGGVPWNGSVYIDPPPGLSPERELMWRILFDIRWVLANLITILDKSANRPVKFVPNRPQDWVLWNFYDQLAQGEPNRQVDLKGRQFGFSTLWTCMLFVFTALRGQNSFILAHLEAPGKSIFDKAENALKTLPSFEMQEWAEYDEDGVGIGDPVTSQLISLVEPPTNVQSRTLMAWVSKTLSGRLRRDSAENIDAGVGETYQNLQCTEVPLFRNAAHTIGKLLPAIPKTPGSCIAYEFTARNEGDYAHNLWLRAAQGKGMNRAVFSAWYWHLDYGRKWRANDEPFSPEEEDYRDIVAAKGHEYPLGPDGRLIPRLQLVHAEKGRVDLSDIAVGFRLTDEQLLFRRDAIEDANGDMVQWRSEYPYCPEEAFAVAGRKLVPPNVMDLMDVAARDPLKNKEGRFDPGIGEYKAFMGAGGKARAQWRASRQGRVHRFELPRPNATYIVWADPSSGAGVDPAGCGVDRVEFGKTTTVCSFEGFERPHKLARILARMGRHYRDDAVLDPATGKIKPGSGRPCRIGLERNTFGQAVIHELDNLKYKRICRFTEKVKADYKPGQDRGFPTQKDTKMPMLQEFVAGCYDGQVVVPCRRTLGSIRGMQYLDDDDRLVGAPRGMHDDLAMGRAISFHFSKQFRAFRTRPVEPEHPGLRGRNRLFPRAG